MLCIYIYIYILLTKQLKNETKIFMKYYKDEDVNIESVENVMPCLTSLTCI
jgi:hypothetical protein